MCDLLMGIYLFFIAIADLSYRDHYIDHDYHWRTSWTCELSGKFLCAMRVNILLDTFHLVEYLVYNK